ncbi:MAG: hypothetical protein HOO89_09585 [Ferruginibacter sp.]|nr:hypothetical protein [Ferruginibacter sp.]
MKKYLSIILLLFIACNTQPAHKIRDVNRCFYFWKTNFMLSDAEKIAITTLKINTLYLKFFDVDWDDVDNSPKPIAKLQISDSNYLQSSTLNIVPTIFITNECIYKIDSLHSTQLAQKILMLTKNIIATNLIQNVNEIQIDCDWTATTKEKYFAFLKSLQNLEKRLNFSATIRLHQIKFENKTGVPPVKKGMLMCYNMGNLTNINTNNSILDNSELKKYIANLQNYPLPLDVALPLFEWKVLFRNKKYKGLIEKIPDSLLSSKLFSKNVNNYTALKDTTIFGYKFKKNDLLRNEQTKYNQVLEAANILNKKIKNTNIKVSLFHLDTITLTKYTTNEMENIFNAMR